MLLYSAIGTGAGVLVAQAFGRNDLNDVSKVAALSLVTSGIWHLHSAAARFISRAYPQVHRSARRTGRGRFSLFSAFFCSRSPDRHECCRHRDFSVVERFKDTHVHHHGRGGS